MSTFAKIFDSEIFGQIVVMKDTSDEGDPCVVVVFDPQIDGVQVFKSQFGFEDESRRDCVFDDASVEKAESVVRQTMFEFLAAEDS